MDMGWALRLSNGYVHIAGTLASVDATYPASVVVDHLRGAGRGAEGPGPGEESLNCRRPPR
jgi:hypothetical protein